MIHDFRHILLTILLNFNVNTALVLSARGVNIKLAHVRVD